MNTAVKLSTQGQVFSGKNTSTSIILDSMATETKGQIIYNVDNTDVLTLKADSITLNNYMNIFGNSGNVLSVGGAYFTASGSTYSSGVSNNTAVYSLKTTDNIISSVNIYALSDSRIKTNVKDIEDEWALDKLMRIEPKTYNYIDVINRTQSRVYGFIAQQVRDVIPEAVSLISDYIPNIYKNGIVTGDMIEVDMGNEMELDENSKEILMIDDRGNRMEVGIREIDRDGNRIRLDREIGNRSLFIYGTKVNDFHILEKNYIYTLGVCATQELKRKIDRLKEIVDRRQVKIDRICSNMGITIGEIESNISYESNMVYMSNMIYTSNMNYESNINWMDKWIYSSNIGYWSNIGYEINMGIDMHIGNESNVIIHQISYILQI